MQDTTKRWLLVAVSVIVTGDSCNWNDSIYLSSFILCFANVLWRARFRRSNWKLKRKVLNTPLNDHFLEDTYFTKISSESLSGSSRSIATLMTSVVELPLGKRGLIFNGSHIWEEAKHSDWLESGCGLCPWWVAPTATKLESHKRLSLVKSGTPSSRSGNSLNVQPGRQSQRDSSQETLIPSTDPLQPPTPRWDPPPSHNLTFCSCIICLFLLWKLRASVSSLSFIP